MSNEKSKLNSQKIHEGFFNPFEKIVSRLKKEFKSTLYSKKGGMNCIDPKNTDIKAPPHKALSIKELELKEYVKTEEDLRK